MAGAVKCAGFDELVVYESQLALARLLEGGLVEVLLGRDHGLGVDKMALRVADVIAGFCIPRGGHG